MKNWTPAAALAVKQPPASLSQLALTVIESENGFDPDFGVEFAVSCKTCNHAVFKFSGFPIVMPDPSHYDELRPGQTLWRPPHHLKCVNCGNVAKAFDARTDGYDGILNGGNAYESGTHGEAFVAGTFNITITVVYNNDLDEQIEPAKEAAVQPPDLFDSFVIRGTPVEDGMPFEEVYECA
jgi:hypothetical protein